MQLCGEGLACAEVVIGDGAGQQFGLAEIDVFQRGLGVLLLQRKFALERAVFQAA